ncbi:transcription factor BEE 2-like [Zingiber officinale]|uniref:transcription factor BEE 2-like n=1 Tax=Zingiber officinale TaxID=94328 RepID=UPI001C4AE56A|nr:transcription factor BEE 2-like [Zingiber officinale]
MRFSSSMEVTAPSSHGGSLFNVKAQMKKKKKKKEQLQKKNAMEITARLEEIINYVQSLQNQVGFLSMRLAAATRSYEGRLEDLMEAITTSVIQL